MPNKPFVCGMPILGMAMIGLVLQDASPAEKREIIEQLKKVREEYHGEHTRERE